MAKQDIQKLDTTKADRKVWLVKMPNFVAQNWKSICEQSLNGDHELGPELGVVRWTTSASESSEPEFALSLTGSQVEGKPKDFKMRLRTGDSNPLVVFSDQQGRSSTEGRVDQKFDVELDRNKAPSGGLQLDSQYRAMARDRHQKADLKVRTMQVIDDPRAGVFMRKIQKAASKRKEVKSSDNKRLRLGKDDLERQLFVLFEQQPHWNFIQLQRQTDQPSVWLKEVLNGIATLNKKGPHRDLWEIKKEYRRQSVTDVTAASQSV